jgi:hypothetical protein
MRVRLIASLAVCCAVASCARSTTTTTTSPSPTGEYKPQATEWFLRSIASDGRTVSLVYTMSGVASGCERKGTTAVTELPDKVVVTTNKLVLQGARACTEELGYVDVAATLNAPLGSRALVGCRPPKTDPSENSVCRDRNRGGALPPAYPSPAG